MVRYILFFLFVFSGFKASSQILTLSEAITKALAQNYSVKVAKNNIEIAQNTNNIGNAGLLPTLGVNAGYSYTNSKADLEFSGGIPPQNDAVQESQNYNASIVANYVLFNGLANITAFKQLGAQSDLAELQTRLSIESTVLQVVNAYFQLVREQQQLEILSFTKSISKERLKRTEISYEYGSGGKIDQLNAQVDFNQDSSNYLSMLQNVNTSKNELNFLMGEDMQNVFTVDTSSFKVNELATFSQVVSDAKANNVNLLLASVNLELSEISEKLNKSFYYPQVALNASYGYNRSENTVGILLSNQSLGFTGGITLGWNLFDGNRRKTALQNAKIQLESGEYRKKEAELLIQKELQNMYDLHQNNLRIVELEKQNIKYVELNLSRSQSLFNGGQISSLEFRQAQLNLQLSKSRLSNAIYASKITEYQLMRLRGNILKTN